MARVNSLFEIKGKIGNVIFSKWRKSLIARQYQPDIHDANSSAQKSQRSRMVALLQFLKPLNKTFIRFFNTPFSKKSTPWGKAIKDNMQGVSTEGCFHLNSLQLGEPRFPAPIISEAIYNPFIDQVHFEYQYSDFSTHNEQSTYLATSVLGKYKTVGEHHEFDIRHLLTNFPEGKFWCSIYDGVYEYAYQNYWQHGRLWLSYYDTYCWDKIYNPAENSSEGASFELVPMISDFNTDISDDIAPVDAFSWQFQQIQNEWKLVFSIDFTKAKHVHSNQHKIIFSTASFQNGQYIHSFGEEWDLNSSTFQLPFGSEGYNGSIILLYAVYTDAGKRISRFNRIYIDTGSDGVQYPYFEQLFDCNYSYPASFILNGNQCGFCGSINELFSDFIDLFEQGIIAPIQPPTPAEFRLILNPVDNGNIVVTGYQEADGENYYFNEGDTAQLQIVPNSGYEFDTWSGNDAEDLINIDGTHYSILMSKNRVLAPSFMVVASSFNILSITPSDHANLNISGFDHQVGNDYYYLPNAAANIIINPLAGYDFSHFEGTGAAVYIQLGHWYFRITMNNNYTLQPIYTQL